MTQLPSSTFPIHRRNWLTLALSALAGCGGADGLTAGRPGTGGTGLFAQGTITGFGSVIVNGIRFDDVTASVQIDGQAATSADLRLGMVARVQGQRGAALSLGVANAIEVWSIAQGPVSQVRTGQFVVAGMLIQTDSATVLDGISAATPLVDGMRVAVWGLMAGANATAWTATRVARVTTSTTVSSGFVGDGTKLNGITLAGPLAASVPLGQLVRCEGALTAPGPRLQVDTFRLLDLQVSDLQQGDAELEGLVTALLGGGRFLLGNVEIDASAASISTTAQTLAVGQRIEVHGVWQGSVLKADQLEVESGQKLNEVEIEARIEQFSSLSSFVVRQQRCDASTARFLKGSAADLKVGIKVKLKGTKAGDVLLVTQLEVNP